MENYTDIFLDFDDTLYDTHGNSIIALRKLYDIRHWEKIMPSYEAFRDDYFATNVEVWKAYAHGEIDRDTLIVERYRRPVTEMVKQCGGDTSWITPEWCVAASDQYGDIISQEKGVVDGAKELLTYLTDKGYRLHLCSNGFYEVQYRKLQSSGLKDFFKTVVLSEDAGANKPRKEFFDYAFKVTGAEPDTTILIGDNYDTDITGALNAGIDSILFNRWNINVDELQRKPTFVVNRLQEIKGIL
jgi:putative hydrolase of the HAD superfamily